MEACYSETSLTTHNPALCQTKKTSSDQHLLWKPENLNRKGHELVDIHCSTAHVNQLKFLLMYFNAQSKSYSGTSVHKSVETWHKHLMKILLVCWMNKCGSFRNLRTVNTLTRPVHRDLPISFSSLNSQMTNKHKHSALKRKYTLCSMNIFLIRSFILVKSCTKQGWRMLLHNHKHDWLLNEGTRGIF